MIEVQVKAYLKDDDKTHTHSIKINEPRICMQCKNTGKQEFINCAGTFGDHDMQKAITIFACSYCGSNTLHFMNTHEESKEGMPKSHYLESFDTIPMNRLTTSTVPPQIASIFPEFFEIYQQSSLAEEQRLMKIAGMGYRKSLEFLVTDFLIKYPVPNVSEDWLKNPKTSLSSKINKLTNNRLKNLSKAISFIGNDETHYTRRHPEHDVQSIKIFLNALLSEVQNELTHIESEKLLNKSE